MAILNLYRDSSGGIAYAPPPSENNYRYTLLAGAEQHFTIPGTYDVWLINFSIQNNLVYVGFNVTANDTVENGPSNIEQNPQSRSVKKGTVISMITPDISADVGICLWGYA